MNRTFRQGKLSRTPTQAGEILSIDEVHSRYAGRWVLLRTTAVDTHHTPIEGEVLVHGTHTRVLRALSQLASDRDRPPLPYYLFSAGSRAMPTAVLQNALAAISHDAEKDSR